MSAPEDFDARTAFGHVAEGLKAQARYLKSLDEKQDRQATRLDSMDGHLTSIDGHLASLDRKFDAMLTRLDRLNTNIVRGFTKSVQRDGDLAKRVKKLETEVAALKRRAPRKR